MAESTRKKCCNPYEVHQKVQRERLFEVPSESDVPLRFRHLVGKLLCDNCLKKARAEAKTEASTATTTPVGCSQTSSNESTAGSQGFNLDPAVLREECSEFLESQGLSPLVVTSRSIAGKAQYAQRKLGDITDVLRKKICLALEINCSDVQKQEAKSAPKDIDLMAILTAVKSKLPSVDRREKIKLLTLCPVTWSIEEARKFFEVSRYYLRTARKIRIEHGIFADMPHVKGWTLPESTKQLIIDFYNDDEYSRVMPGKKDFVSIGGGLHVQKRLLLLNLKELYKLFKVKYSDLNLKIGLSTFCALRPKWCIIAGASGTHNVCVCTYHQNCKLKLKALGINERLRDIIPSLVCKVATKDCMLGLCSKCLTVSKITDYLKDKVKSKLVGEHPEDSEDPTEDPIDELFLDDNVKFKEWTKTDGSDLSTKICKVRELIHLLALSLKKLIPHHYISVEQAEFLKKYKEDMSSNQAVILMDFSMNYSCLVQDASQGYHWSKKGVTVHPVVIYYKNANNELKNENLCFISEDIIHDVSMVNLIQEKTISFINEKLPEVNEVMYVSDGCAAQYKNCQSFLNLCKHFEKFGIKATWFFFATSHGKSACDGLGGTVKREATKASLQRIYNDHITNADSLFKFCKEKLSKTITFFQLSSNEVKQERARASAVKAVTIPGTRGFHHFTPISGTEIECRRVSSDPEPALIHSLCDIEPTSQDFSQSEYVAVLIESKVFIGMITDVNQSEMEVDLALLLPSLPSTKFSWPSDYMVYVAPFPQVLCKVNLIELNDVQFELPTFVVHSLNLRAKSRQQLLRRK